MMNRYTVVALIFCTLIGASTIVSAQTDTPSSTTPITTTSLTKRPFTAEPTLQKIAQTRLLNLAANMSNRMDSAVSRLQNVIDRLTSRLSKMAAEGTDVSQAQTEIILAQTKLDEAKRNLVNIDTEVNAFIGSATPRENWENLKNTYLGTKEAIMASHQSILATITLAQNAGVTPSETTSTSTDPATNN